MRTHYAFAILLIAGITTLNTAMAQSDAGLLVAAGENPVAKPSVTNVEPVNNVQPAISTQLLTVDAQNQTVRLNYALPSFTYSAVLLIQDFTGRTIKTLNVNPHNKPGSEFYINDLLSGPYNYTLILDNQKKLYGEFSVKD